MTFLFVLAMLFAQARSYPELPESVPDVSAWPAHLASEEFPLVFDLPATRNYDDELFWFRLYAAKEGICPPDAATCRVLVHYDMRADSDVPGQETQMVARFACAGPLGTAHGLIWQVRDPFAAYVFAHENGAWESLNRYKMPYYMELKSFSVIQRNALTRAMAPEMRR